MHFTVFFYRLFTKRPLRKSITIIDTQDSSAGIEKVILCGVIS
jgi:hypothetical protein